MAQIKSANTKPEMTVRRLLHRLGYRFRLHRRDLPGKPDLVFASRRKVIFVHGCFWHQHEREECLDGRKPKSNSAYWGPKLERNVQRDSENCRRLMEAGWDVLVVWECEVSQVDTLQSSLTAFLGPAPTASK